MDEYKPSFAHEQPMYAAHILNEQQAEIEELTAELAAARAENERLREAARWIPVSERLPDEGDEVIVQAFFSDAWDVWEGTNGAKLTGVNDCIASLAAHIMGGKWYLEHNEEIYGKVTHWQTLPEPVMFEREAKRE